jgi:hypothetical protein
MACGAGGQQRAAQPGCGRGQGVDALVQVPVGRRAADGVVGGQLGQPGAVEKSAQDQHRLPVTAQRPAPTPRASATALGGQQAGHEGHGGLPDREHDGVTDRIGHSRTSVRLDICGTSSVRIDMS